jgi:hypothetical protein
MRERNVSIPQLLLFAGTRVALGIGVGMLLSGKFNRDVRKGAGWALVGVGALTTIPLMMSVAYKPQLAEPFRPTAAA